MDAPRLATDPAPEPERRRRWASFVARTERNARWREAFEMGLSDEDCAIYADGYDTKEGDRR